MIEPPRARLKALLLGEITIEVILDGEEKKGAKEWGGAPSFTHQNNKVKMDKYLS